MTTTLQAAAAAARAREQAAQQDFLALAEFIAMHHSFGRVIEKVLLDKLVLARAAAVVANSAAYEAAMAELREKNEALRLLDTRGCDLMGVR